MYLEKYLIKIFKRKVEQKIRYIHSQQKKKQ